MSKKILCVVLCILMCLSMLPIGVFAEENPDTAQTEALPEEISEEAPAVEALPEEEEAPEEEALPEEELTEEASDGAGDQLQGAIPYLVYENGDFQTKWVTDYTLVGNGEWRDLPKYEEVKMEPGCYVFKGKEYTNARIVFTGKTEIILMNDCYMSFDYGISLYSGSSLTVYGQPIEKDENGEDIAKPGEMFCSGTKLMGAGIGGLLDFDGEGEANVTCGDVYIHGGKVTVIGGDYCAGIGGGGCYKDDYCGNGGNVYIYGGEVNATGGLHGAGIGGGCGEDESGNGGSVYIYGGTVTATGGENGAGIGGGTKYEVNEFLSNKGVGGSGGYCEINGGTVTATGGEYVNTMGRTGSGAGIGGGEWGNGGTVVINGGKVIANAGYLAAGIGGGNEGAGGKVYLNGGELEVTGDPEAYAIGGGDGNSEEGGVFVGDNVLYVVDLRNGREVISNAPPRGWPYDPSWSWAAFFLMKDYIHVDLVSVESLYVPVEYLKYNEERKHYDLTTNAKTIPILNRGGTLSYWANGWYVVDCDTTISSRVTVNGDVNLILKDGCTLRADNGINVKAGNQLTIYAQSKDPDSMGVLIANAQGISNNGLAGIGGGYSNNKGEDCGIITIYGGYVEALGGSFGAGIGGGGDTMNGYGGNGGTVTVYDGIVKATAGQSAAGIGGGGDGCPGGTLTIYGGDVEAVGSYFGAAVGGSYEGNGGTVNMFDGKLTAIGGDSSTGIGHGEKGTGGTLNFYGGIIDASTADDTNTVDAINSAQITVSPSEAQSARLTTSDGQNDIVYAAKTTADLSGMQNIHLEMTTRQKVPYLAYENGDFVTKECGKYISFFTDRLSTLTGSGDNNGWYVLVGGSTNDRISVSGDVKIILKDGCTFNAENGVLVEEGSSLTIYAQSTTYETKGKLYATSNTDYYAGIGSGPNKASGSIAIHGGYVDAKGGGQAAGIGGGSGRNGTVTIYGGSVYGRGGNSIDPNTESTNFGGGAGIGGGYNGEGTVTIYGGSVYGYGGSEGAAGIGGGCGKKGTVTIYGGSAEGHGGKALADNSRSTPKGGGAGIGGGYNGAGIVKLYGGSAYGYGGVGGAAGIGGGCGSAGSCDILIDGNAYALAYGGTSYISSDIKSGTILNGGSGIGVGDGCTSGTVEIRHARVHAFGGENHNPPYTKAGDGIKATKIIVNPNAGYMLQVSIDDGNSFTNYSTKTVITTNLAGKPIVHLLTAAKTNTLPGDDTDTPSEPTKPTKPTDPDKPNTGDTSLMGLWITVMLVSAMGFAVCITKKRRVK